MKPLPIILDTEEDLEKWMDDNSDHIVDRYEDICYDGGYSWGYIIYKFDGVFYKLNFYFDNGSDVVFCKEYHWRGEERYIIEPVKRREVITYKYEKYKNN